MSDVRAADNGCGCFDCGLPYGDDGFPDLIIPIDIWRRISPTKDEGGLLCPNCIVRRVAALGCSNIPAAFMSGPLKSVDPDLMHSIRWIENLREQGHGWYCPQCGGPRDVCRSEQKLTDENQEAPAVESEDSALRDSSEDTAKAEGQAAAASEDDRLVHSIPQKGR